MSAPPSRLQVAHDVVRGGRRRRYAEHARGWGELRLPAGVVPHPVAVLLHGGSWQAGFGPQTMRAVAADLARHGWATWTVAYRRMGRGEGGGWPATFADVAAAIDHLSLIDAPLDLGRVVLVGHSAGGQLALWAAGREELPRGAPGADPRVVPVHVIAQAPVADLERAASLVAPGGLVTRLLGGTPAEVPERYALANPQRRVPLEVPATLVHTPQDRTVSAGQSRDYARAARAAGAQVALLEPAGGHRDHVNPRSPAWRAALGRIAALPDPGIDSVARGGKEAR